MMKQVEDFIYQQPESQQIIMFYLHELMTQTLNLTAKIRYQIPFYYNKSWICYLNPQKKGGVELAFTRGNELSNEQGLLDFKGRKQVASVNFEKRADIDEHTLREVLMEAILLDEEVPYASKREK